MPDNKLTDNAIIKALECCALQKQHCPSSCPLKDNYNCKKILFKYTLDLINRLQAENERLKIYHRENPLELALLADELTEKLKTAKTEAYKEFAERLRKRMGFCDLPMEIVKHHIDNLLKELVGEDK